MWELFSVRVILLAKLRPIAQTALSGEWPFSEIEFTEARASQTPELH